MNNHWVRHTEQITLEGLEASVRTHMPSGSYKTFYLWALSEANPDRELWLHLLGIPQFVKLTLGLLHGSVPQDTFGNLLEYSVPMNIYLIFEVASDDLAIGLARPTLSSRGNYEERQAILLGFNQAMTERLRGRDYVANHILKNDVQDLAHRISGFTQSLIPDKHQALANTYINSHPDVDMRSLEYTLWPRLFMNVETAAQVSNLVDGNPSGRLVRHGLMARYRGVSTLLRNEDLSWSERVHIGVDTILVIPTLAYYTGIVAEKVAEIGNFRTVIDNGEYSEALYNAALAVRLLNDVGTPLLVQPELRTNLVSMLRDCGTTDLTFDEMMMLSVEHFGSSLARLKKDMQHGEFNICLCDLERLSTQDAIDALEWRLGYVADTYARARRVLDERLQSINRRLGIGMVSDLIRRFVDFHAMLYLNPHTDPMGEYTVGV